MVLLHLISILRSLRTFSWLCLQQILEIWPLPPYLTAYIRPGLVHLLPCLLWRSLFLCCSYLKVIFNVGIKVDVLKWYNSLLCLKVSVASPLPQRTFFQLPARPNDLPNSHPFNCLNAYLRASPLGLLADTTTASSSLPERLVTGSAQCPRYPPGWLIKCVWFLLQCLLYVRSSTATLCKFQLSLYKPSMPLSSFIYPHSLYNHVTSAVLKQHFSFFLSLVFSSLKIITLPNCPTVCYFLKKYIWIDVSLTLIRGNTPQNS